MSTTNILYYLVTRTIEPMVSLLMMKEKSQSTSVQDRSRIVIIKRSFYTFDAWGACGGRGSQIKDISGHQMEMISFS